MHVGGESTERCQRQEEIDEHAPAKGDEQKDTETSDFTISHGSRLKLAENGEAHKGFSWWRLGHGRRMWQFRIIMENRVAWKLLGV